MNTIAFLMVLLWVAGWTIAAIRAGFRTTTLPGPIRREGNSNAEYLGT